MSGLTLDNIPDKLNELSAMLESAAKVNDGYQGITALATASTEQRLIIDFLLDQLPIIERETAERCANIALDGIGTYGSGDRACYKISRTIQETFGVNV